MLPSPGQLGKNVSAPAPPPEIQIKLVWGGVQASVVFQRSADDADVPPGLSH